jgi:NAD(P)-dependent dehydrogenase (short-subunit alcohol dehydrogenase family)
VLAARNETLGQAALEQLRAELAAAGRQDADLIYRQLGITDSQSVQAFADWARQELRTVDVLVNNAGKRVSVTAGAPSAGPCTHQRQHQLHATSITPARSAPCPLPPPLPSPPAGFAHKGDVFGADECAQTLAVNFHGTAALTEALLPLIPEGGRIINMCSSEGPCQQAVGICQAVCQLWASLHASPECMHCFDFCPPPHRTLARVTNARCPLSRRCGQAAHHSRRLPALQV